MATISLFSSAIKEAARVRAHQPTHWFNLIERIQLATESCYALIDQDTLQPFPKEELKQRLQPLLVFCLNLQTEVKAAEQLIQSQPQLVFEDPKGDISSPAGKKYTAMKNDTHRLLDQLCRRAERIFREQLNPAWENAQTALETALAQAGTPAGVVGFFQSNLPKAIGGTWPRCNAELAACSASHPPLPKSPPKEVLPLTGTAEQQPPTYLSEIQALATLQKRIRLEIALPADKLRHRQYAEVTK